MFSVTPVSSRNRYALEPLGTKPKFWFTDDQERRILFKAEARGTGEDWAEKVACELCRMLVLPHVVYNLAFDAQTGLPGVICENCAPPPVELVLGNQLLLARDPAYPGDGRRYKVQAHTVKAVADALSDLAVPPSPWSDSMPSGIQSALDVFVGYVMLDAWIANQDRHHENWGALKTGNDLCLAPTFDHGASLARNLSDSERAERLSTRDSRRQIDSFARKARSAIYGAAADPKALTTFDAWIAFSRLSPAASRIWKQRLCSITDQCVSHILDEIPPARISETGRRFTLSLLLVNQQRICSGDIH